MENHHLCSYTTAPHEPLADITPPEEDQQAPAATPTTTLQDEKITLLGEIITMIHETTTQDACRNHLVHQTLAQHMNDFHDADQQQLQRMTPTLGTIITEQQQMNEQIQARQKACCPIHIYCTPICHCTTKTQPDLTRASVWTGDVLSRIWRDRLLGAAAGAAFTLASLWLLLVSAAPAMVMLHA